MSRQSMLVSVVVLLLALTCSDACAQILSCPFFSQQDPRWANKFLDNSPYTIGAYGCALTSVTMVVNYYGIDTDPNRLNDALTDIGGIDSAGILYWDKVPEVCDKRVTWVGRIDLPTWDKIDSELNKAYPVIAEVTATGISQHFIVVWGKEGNDYYFYDPADLTETVRVWPTGWHGTYTLIGLRIYHLTIQARINDCNEGDIIIVPDDIYTGEGNRDIDFNGKAITLRSENGPDNCIVDCEGIETDPHRGFYFHSGEDANSVVDGFTITNGYLTTAGTGAGIYCSSSSPTIKNCIITNGTAYGGGGIYFKRSSPRISNCIISNNSAGWGGGIYCVQDSCPTIINCTIRNNSGGNGGGIRCSSSNLVILDCTIEENSADSGGGISSISSSLSIINCTVAANLAGGDGGGFYLGGSTSSPIITNCTITANSADHGGGVYNSAGDLTITNCNINGNKANRGGGLYCYTSSSNSTLTNCTICSNWAVGSLYENDGGGGIYCNSSNSTLTNCILWDNIAARGSEVFLRGSSSVIAIGYTDIRGGMSEIYLKDDAELCYEIGNINVGPLFTEPGNWDPNGTPGDASDDFWIDGDYHLKSQAGRWDPNSQTWVYDGVTSRCIDAGSPGFSLGDEPMDIHNTRINMGAYGGTDQASGSPDNWSLTADLTNDGIVRTDDVLYQVLDWLFSADQQSGDLNRDGITDLIDFALLASDWFRRTSWHGP